MASSHEKQSVHLAGTCTVVLLVLLKAVNSAQLIKQDELLPCNGKKFGILEFASIAHDYTGDMGCIEHEVVKVDAATGVVYYKNVTRYGNFVYHWHGTHSAPWYMFQSLRSSKLHTREWFDGDYILVYDYCYYIYWLAYKHTLERPELPGSWSPGVPLLNLYRWLVREERWRRTGGRDFVFFHSHPGFADGTAGREFYEFICTHFANATHLVSEHDQLSSHCPNFSKMRVISVPYVPNAIDVEKQFDDWDLPPRPLAQRDILLFSSAKCGQENVGKRMRLAVSKALQGQGADVEVSCTNAAIGVAGGQHLPFAAMLDRMARARFCLALIGDAASTRRLGEMFMAGCIPVFVGPPYNTAPLASVLHWPAMSIWFNVTGYHDWLNEDFQWGFGPAGSQVAPKGPRYWFPEAEIPVDKMIQVRNVADIITYLRAIPAATVEAKLGAVRRARPLFAYRRKLSRRLSANAATLAALCGDHDWAARVEAISSALPGRRRLQGRALFGGVASEVETASAGGVELTDAGMEMVVVVVDAADAGEFEPVDAETEMMGAGGFEPVDAEMEMMDAGGFESVDAEMERMDATGRTAVAHVVDSSGYVLENR